MTDSEPTVVEQRLRIGARPETVWRYWTDPERLCQWWGTAADLDPRPGGTCVVELGRGGVMRGEYLELVPHERIVFTFGWDAHPDAPDLAPGSSRVEITLTADGDDTILELRHTGLPPALAGEHRAGWGHFLSILSTAASGAAGDHTDEALR